jgi:hypothetical protein
LLGLPIDRTRVRREALVLLSVPCDIGTCRSKQIDANILRTAVQHLGIDIACIDELLLWPEIFLLYGGRARVVRDESPGRVDRGDHVWAVLLTGVRQLHLEPDPPGGALLAGMGIEIGGRAD